MARYSRGRRLASVVAGALLAALPAAAHADGGTDKSAGVRVFASLGGALGGIGGYEGYGLGLLLRAGTELRLFHAGGTSHALLLVLEGGRFPALELDTPFLFDGVQLDVSSLRTNWRLYPWRRQGLYVDVGSGLLLARDRIAVTLPGRDLSSTEWRVGVPIELGTGWVLFDHLDVSLRYTQIVFTENSPASFGFLSLALGVRL